MCGEVVGGTAFHEVIIQLIKASAFSHYYMALKRVL